MRGTGAGVRPEGRAAFGGGGQGAAACCLGLLLLVAPLVWQLAQPAPTLPPPSASSPEMAGDAAAEGRVDASPTRGAPRSSKPLPSDSLDINRADAESLQSLPGVGPALAQRIVADREARGPFRRAEDLGRVPGIGPRRLLRLQAWVRTAEHP